MAKKFDDKKVPVEIEIPSLADMRLISVSCKQGPTKLRPPEMKQQVTVRVMEKADEIGPGTPVLISLTLAGGSIQIEAAYGLVLIFSDEMSTEFLQKFAQSVGVQVVWPYWREFVHSITGKMGLPSLLIPLINANNMEFPEGTSPKKIKNAKPRDKSPKANIEKLNRK